MLWIYKLSEETQSLLKFGTPILRRTNNVNSATLISFINNLSRNKGMATSTIDLIPLYNLMLSSTMSIRGASAGHSDPINIFMQVTWEAVRETITSLMVFGRFFRDVVFLRAYSYSSVIFHRCYVASIWHCLWEVDKKLCAFQRLAWLSSSGTLSITWFLSDQSPTDIWSLDTPCSWPVSPPREPQAYILKSLDLC